jgi:adenine-specific DNA-methyltransferase
MGRRWIAVEWSADIVASFAMPRLVRVVDGSDHGGATATTAWKGGGGFRVVDVAPSMYEEVAGMVFLADWATNGALAEAVAAQLGFAYEPVPPFCGRTGRRRLAVIDGLVDEHVVRLVAGDLADGEQVVIAATSVDPAARVVLRELRRGSTLKKIPDALLASYQRTTALHDISAVRHSVGSGS